MGIKVYYSEISAQKEVKKRQQKVMMILESKLIPYEAIDITEAGRESDKDFMLTTAKTRGDSKTVVSPQIYNDETYCGDYEDFELANENDELETFLGIEKTQSTAPTITNGNQNGNAVNGTSRESSAEKEAKVAEESNANVEATPAASEDNPPHEEEEAEPMSTTEAVPEPQAKEEGLDEIEPKVQAEEEEEEDE